MCCFLSCVGILLCFSGLAKLFIRNKITRQKKVSRLVCFLSGQLMRALGFKVRAVGEGFTFLRVRDNGQGPKPEKREELDEPKEQKELKELSKQNFLIIANHVSYTDVTLLHSFICDNRFITHYEWREQSPFLDLIARSAGVYFIERRNLQNIRKELRATGDILKRGLSLVFFPEGTSSDGSTILPFHPLFFAGAVSANKSVLPVYIEYTKVNGEKFSEKNRDLVCWHDPQISFARHLFKLGQVKSVEVCLKFLPPISSEGKTARALAEESRAVLLAQKHPS